MKKFFEEFKKFITRGNVLDMAVGVIVGGAFTAIVNGLSNNILKPLINYLLAIILGKDTLAGIHTMLLPAYVKDEAGANALDEAGNLIVDLANSIYIDWGAFINAIINFFLIAIVLFCIVKFINGLRDNGKSFSDKLNGHRPSKADRKAMKADGVKLRDKEAVSAWYAARAKEEADAAAAAKAAAEEQARLDRESNPTAEDLLKEIRDLLKER